MRDEVTMDELTRRSLIGGAAALAVAGRAATAQGGAPDERVPLWPGRIPGDLGKRPVRKVNDRSKTPGAPDRWTTGIDVPALVVRRPAQPNGAAVLLVPGGGYGFLAYDNEGTEQARWLNALGVTCFILLYRLPSEGWGERRLVPLQDAQRAMRVIRAGAARFGIDPRRVATIGFSAGGHLAGSLATRFAEPVYAPVDAADRLSARPDLAGLIYPVVSMDAAITHQGSRNNLLGPTPAAAEVEAASVERRVGADTPPVFLVHASDDGTVPVANSLTLYAALLTAKRPAEMHLFDEGGHGFGTRLPKTTPASAWPTLFAAYAARKGVFPA
ncbi:alpha/beta hydrolase [Sphingomonas sp. A2-49]|uniref:alpha/beta hydrolase n=1 Tax=Sphingomonas sp. A2-49 TaxID=1391375 RepID=UPI0021D0996F|nr:alpha/beta hydrolase [Sphingomonas sp. A2-49]MCU6453689.1 alpha/beta hydrolase [Sphingomonas sp. A2-49]